MLLLAEQQTEEPQPATSSPSPTATTTFSSSRNELELVRRTAWRASIIAGFNVAALVLGARVILLLAVLGSLALTWIAVQGGTPLQLGAVAIYSVLTVLPLVWLASRR